MNDPVESIIDIDREIESLQKKTLEHHHVQEPFFMSAEGTGLEPATPCGAIDFESTSSPIRIPSGADIVL